jgi:hypothetical protein
MHLLLDPPDFEWNSEYAMFTKILLTLSVALSLAGALTTQAAPPKKNPPPILISSLPFTITAPGTYVLTGNLSYTASGTNPVAITINVSAGSIGSAIILDLNGFTITNSSINTTVYAIDIQSPNSTGGVSPIRSPVTIRNGKIALFYYGVYDVGVSDVNLNNLTINTNNPGESAIRFELVASSTITNCIISGGNYGIEDIGSPGGNSYANDTFTNTSPIVVTGKNGGVPTVENSCSFNGPLIN